MNEIARRDCFGKVSQTGDKEQAATPGETYRLYSVDTLTASRQ